jgi:hypothetical protein
MENLNIDAISNRKKNLYEEIIDNIEKNYLISNFNTNLNKLFANYKNELRKKNIYFHFVFRYINTKNISHLIKYHFPIKQKYQKQNENAYLYLLFYIYLRFELFEKINKENNDNKEKEKEKKSGTMNIDKIISVKDFFKLIEYFYISKIINWRQVINILKYLIYQIKSLDNEFPTSIIVSILSNCLKFFGKIVKDMNEINQKEKDEINNKIKNEFFEELFEILSDSKNNGKFLYLMRNMIREEAIFVLMKLIVNNDFFSEENKKYIEDNIIKIFKNNFRKEHINYFYKILRRILIKFNKFNPKLKDDTSSKEENYETDFNIINKDFLLLIKIDEILMKIIKEEKDQINSNECYYCDKGFAFNNKEKDKIGFQVKDISYTKKGNNIFCILFSFELKECDYEKENKIIFSIVDSENNEKLTLFENGQNICLKYYGKKMNEIVLKKVEYNTIFNFLFFMDKNNIKISINNIDISKVLEKYSDFKPANFKLPDKFKVFVGVPEKIKNQNSEIYSFHGIIYPILLFELNDSKKKDEIYLQLKEVLSKVKNKYYLIAEEYFNQHYNEKNNESEKIMHNYEIYYGLSQDLTIQKKIDKILEKMNNMILYVNPFIIVSSFNKKEKIFKDCNIYQNENNKNITYFYEFNTIPSLEQGKIYSFRDYSVVAFFKINNGLNFNILQIEALYNFILLLGSKEEYLKFPSKNFKEFFSQM